MAGMLPEMKFMSVTPALTAYRAGVDDYRADQDYAQKQEQRNLLKQVGQTAATQGLGAAGAQAMAGGDIATGIKLQDLSLDRQAKLYDFMGRGAAAADTPEKWQAYISTLAKTFGPESVKGFEDFRTRESAVLLSMNAKEQAEMALRKQALAQSSEKNTQDQAFRTRQLDIQERSLQGKPENRTVKDAQGNETIVRIEPGGKTTQIYGSEPAAPSNPYAVGGKLTEGQGKAATFADRMAESHSILTNLEDVNKGVAGGVAGAVANTSIPLMGKIGDTATFNKLSSEDRQKFTQARRNFVNAVLRRESGAVISDDEFSNADKQYFPQPGDSNAVIEQKRQNRITAMQGIMREAGPSYKAPEIKKAPDQKTKLPKGVSADSAISQAKAAIASGKDRNAVISRLKSWGVDTSGL